MTAISLSLSGALPPETDDGNELSASFSPLEKVEEVRDIVQMEVLGVGTQCQPGSNFIIVFNIM